MTPKIGALTIERFRAIRHLEVKDLGRVNLITGKNNTGKSSVLEAIRILSSDASPSVIYDILRSREEHSEEMEDAGRPLDAEGLFLLSSLFHGFPQFSAELKPVEIAARGGPRPLDLSIGAGWFSVERDQDGARRLVPLQRELFGEDDAVPALVITTGGGKRLQPLNSPRRKVLGRRMYGPELPENSGLPCVFVSPYGGEATATLGPMWDNIALSDRENDVVEALRIIDPSISAVSMVGGEGPRRTRKAIVRAEGIPHPVPLRSFGDGLNRLFGISLSLVNAVNGLLLIDEFENGMHHTVQTDVWRAVFALARRLDTQVVATSHSWDSIEAFQKAAAGDPEEGVLVRLSRRGEDVIPTVFREEELTIATRDRIEVR